MRFHLRLTPNEQAVPFDHLHPLIGALHKWLGAENAEHDGVSLYSFGWLRGGHPADGALAFPQGAAWTVSFHDTSAAKRLLAGVLRAPAAAFGMRVAEVREVEPPLLGPRQRFLVDGPVLARATRDDGTRAHLLWSDPAADAALTRTLRRKLAAAGLDGAHLGATVAFDRTYERARTKLATVKGIRYRASECPVVVAGTPEAVRFAWLVGAGELTGSGFGALR